ncbi:MAG: SHOCT domain-containing protein [Oscillospiraceae bacterium]|nr:SHOCT domain-containing protein [Oscillospiraceae bacterium]
MFDVPGSHVDLTKIYEGDLPLILILTRLGVLAFGVCLLILGFKLSKKKADPAPDENAYGVSRSTGKDPLFRKFCIIMSCAALGCSLVSLGTTVVKAHSIADDAYMICHSKSSSLENESKRLEAERNALRAATSAEKRMWEKEASYYKKLPDTSKSEFRSEYYERYSDQLIFSIAGIVLALLIPLIMYPTRIARKAEHPNTAAIAWINALFGTAVIGWAIALIMAKSESKPAAAPSAVLPPQPTPADELAKYKALLDQGAITPEEYERKKQQLLNL